MENNIYLEDSLIDLPDWCRTERETEKVVQRLSSVKELTGYLTNPDEFIRRIALIRLGELKLRDSVPILEEIVDDRLESSENIMLAAWSLKSVSKRWGMEFLTSAKVLDSYTGNESFEDMFGVRFIDSSYGIRLGKDTNSAFPEIKRENFNRKSGTEIVIDTEFPAKEWLLSAINLAGTAVKKMPAYFLRLPVFIVKCFKLAKTIQFKKKHQKEPKLSYNNGWYTPGNPHPVCRKRGFNPFFLMKSLFGMLFKTAAIPFRTLLKYRTAVIMAVISAYILTSAVPAGRWIVYRYSGVDLSQMNSNIFCSIGQITSYAINEVKDLAGIATQYGNDTPAAEAGDTDLNWSTQSQSDYSTYTVTAKSGLNLRKNPDSGAEKATDNVLPYQSVVSYLSISKKDSAGKTWLLVRSPEGKEGWASSKWLKEVHNK